MEHEQKDEQEREWYDAGVVDGFWIGLAVSAALLFIAAYLN